MHALAVSFHFSHLSVRGQRKVTVFCYMTTSKATAFWCTSMFGTGWKISFAQWHYHWQWGLTESWLLLIENFSQYPARRHEILTAMQYLEVSSETAITNWIERIFLWSRVSGEIPHRLVKTVGNLCIAPPHDCLLQLWYKVLYISKVIAFMNKIFVLNFSKLNLI